MVPHSLWLPWTRYKSARQELSLATLLLISVWSRRRLTIVSFSVRPSSDHFLAPRLLVAALKAFRFQAYSGSSLYVYHSASSSPRLSESAYLNAKSGASEDDWVCWLMWSRFKRREKLKVQSFSGRYVRVFSGTTIGVFHVHFGRGLKRQNSVAVSSTELICQKRRFLFFLYEYFVCFQQIRRISSVYKYIYKHI